MLKSYPSFTVHFIDRELPMDAGWIYYGWALENDAMMQLSGVARASDCKGYVAQETDRILKRHG